MAHAHRFDVEKGFKIDCVLKRLPNGMYGYNSIFANIITLQILHSRSQSRHAYSKRFTMVTSLGELIWPISSYSLGLSALFVFFLHEHVLLKTSISNFFFFF